MRCVIVVHSYTLEPEDSVLVEAIRCLLVRKTCVDGSRFSPDLHKERRVTLNMRQKNEISNSAAFIAETNQGMWSLLSNTIPHGRTIMYMVTTATEASMMAVGHFAKKFDPGKNALHLTDDSVTRLKMASLRTIRTSFSHSFISGRRLGETC